MNRNAISPASNPSGTNSINHIQSNNRVTG